MGELISISEAVSLGISKLRQPQWVGKLDHLRIDIIDGRHGPWFHLHSPQNENINKRDPVDILCVYLNTQEKRYLPYEGPDHKSPEYQQAREEFNADMARLDAMNASTESPK